MRMSWSAWPLGKPAQPPFLLCSQSALQARPTTLDVVDVSPLKGPQFGDAHVIRSSLCTTAQPCVGSLRFLNVTGKGLVVSTDGPGIFLQGLAVHGKDGRLLPGEETSPKPDEPLGSLHKLLAALRMAVSTAACPEAGRHEIRSLPLQERTCLLVWLNRALDSQQSAGCLWQGSLGIHASRSFLQTSWRQDPYSMLLLLTRC